MKNTRFTQAISINQPVEVIFEYMSNLEQLVHWSSVVLAVKMLSPGVMRLGARASVSTRFLGVQAETMLEVVECRPNRSLMVKSTSSIIPCTFFVQFEPIDRHTTHVVQNALYAYMNTSSEARQQVVSNALQRQVEYDLLNLKDVLEIRS